jgi:hypothetical protein
MIGAFFVEEKLGDVSKTRGRFWVSKNDGINKNDSQFFRKNRVL